MITLDNTIIVTLIPVVGTIIGYWFMTSKHHPDNKQSEFDRLMAIVDRLDKEVAQQRLDIDKLKQEKSQLENEKDELEEEYEALEIAYERQLAKNRELEARIERLENELKEKG